MKARIFVKISLILLFIATFSPSYADTLATPSPTPSVEKKMKVYLFDIKEQIAAPVWRTTQRAFAKAEEIGADLVVIHMNTYGGAVDAADSIRTKILNSTIPVYVLIDNNAASAGALISIACDSIYMVKGASIGAATVVNQTGEVVPDKFQSYMRSMMRSTAEAKGRNPDIAEAMVDPSIMVPGVSDSGKVLTFTTSEAIRHGFCEGKRENIEEMLLNAGHSDYELIRHQLSGMDKVINFLIHPMISGILIMLIIGGLYFELQTPGIGFPLGASVFAALLYFAPLYLEGLATHWEILIFVIGVVLLLVEVFAVPGFGVTGILGLLLMITGLAFAMVENIVTTPISINLIPITKAFFTVFIAAFVALAGSIYLSKKLFSTTAFGHLALDTIQDKNDGFTSATTDYTNMIGKEGIAWTILRPAGKVIVEDEIFDATAISGYIEEGTAIMVSGYQSGQLIVKKI